LSIIYFSAKEEYDTLLSLAELPLWLSA